MLSSSGCMNQFVQVEYDQGASKISCQFLNQTNTSRSCVVVYGQCNHMLVYKSQRNSTFNRISLNINSEVFECYAVTASSDTITVVIEGQISTNAGNSCICTVDRDIFAGKIFRL